MQVLRIIGAIIATVYSLYQAFWMLWDMTPPQHRARLLVYITDRLRRLGDFFHRQAQRAELAADHLVEEASRR